MYSLAAIQVGGNTSTKPSRPSRNRRTRDPSARRSVVHPKIAKSRRELPISGRTRRCIPTPWVNRLALNPKGGDISTRHRYQYGSLTRRKRIRTEDVWQFRYYETSPEGQRRRRSKIIGMLSQYPTPTDALRILERFRLRLNLQNRLGLPITLDALADDYVEKELPLLRYGTQQAHPQPPI